MGKAYVTCNFTTLPACGGEYCPGHGSGDITVNVCVPPTADNLRALSAPAIDVTASTNTCESARNGDRW